MFRSSSTRSRVTSAVKKVFGSGGRSSKPKVSKPKSKSKLKKFGKYAIAGLAGKHEKYTAERRRLEELSLCVF